METEIEKTHDNDLNNHKNIFNYLLDNSISHNTFRIFFYIVIWRKAIFNMLFFLMNNFRYIICGLLRINIKESTYV